MQVRCYRCGWSFGIKREEIRFALMSIKESDGNHYDIPCPRCRHKNRIPLEQLERAAPPSEEEE